MAHINTGLHRRRYTPNLSESLLKTADDTLVKTYCRLIREMLADVTRETAIKTPSPWLLRRLVTQHLSGHGEVSWQTGLRWTLTQMLHWSSSLPNDGPFPNDEDFTSLDCHRLASTLLKHLANIRINLTPV